MHPTSAHTRSRKIYKTPQHPTKQTIGIQKQTKNKSIKIAQGIKPVHISILPAINQFTSHSNTNISFDLFNNHFRLQHSTLPQRAIISCLS